MKTSLLDQSLPGVHRGGVGECCTPFPEKKKSKLTPHGPFFHPTFLAGKIRPGPENQTSDRTIKMSEISELNSLTLLGPSNQKSKLTSGGRLHAQIRLKPSSKWPLHCFPPKKGAKMACFRAFFRRQCLFGAHLSSDLSLQPT